MRACQMRRQQKQEKGTQKNRLLQQDTKGRFTRSHPQTWRRGTATATRTLLRCRPWRASALQGVCCAVSFARSFGVMLLANSLKGLHCLAGCGTLNQRGGKRPISCRCCASRRSVLPGIQETEHLFGVFVVPGRGFLQKAENGGNDFYTSGKDLARYGPDGGKDRCKNAQKVNKKKEKNR